MMKNIKLSLWLTIRSIFSNKKISVVLFILFMCTSIILLSISSVLFGVDKDMMNNLKENYGAYEFALVDMSDNELKELSQFTDHNAIHEVEAKKILINKQVYFVFENQDKLKYFIGKHLLRGSWDIKDNECIASYNTEGDNLNSIVINETISTSALIENIFDEEIKHFYIVNRATYQGIDENSRVKFVFMIFDSNQSKDTFQKMEKNLYISLQKSEFLKEKCLYNNHVIRNKLNSQDKTKHIVICVFVFCNLLLFIILLNILNMCFYKRKELYGTYLSLGMTYFQLYIVIFSELALVMIFAILIGSLLAAMTAYGFTIQISYTFALNFHFSFQSFAVLFIIFIGLIGISTGIYLYRLFQYLPAELLNGIEVHKFSLLKRPSKVIKSKSAVHYLTHKSIFRFLVSNCSFVLSMVTYIILLIVYLYFATDYI